MSAIIWTENWPGANWSTEKWAKITKKIEARAKDRGDYVLVNDDYRIIIETKEETSGYSKTIGAYKGISPYGLFCEKSAGGLFSYGYVAIKSMIANGSIDRFALGWHGTDPWLIDGLTYAGIQPGEDKEICPKLEYVRHTFHRMSYVDFRFWNLLQCDNAILAYRDLATQCKYADQIFNDLYDKIWKTKEYTESDQEIFDSMRAALAVTRRNLAVWTASPYATSEVQDIADRSFFGTARAILRYLRYKREAAVDPNAAMVVQALGPN